MTMENGDIYISHYLVEIFEELKEVFLQEKRKMVLKICAL